MATGIIKAQLAARVAGTISISGFSPNPRAVAPRIGIKVETVAVFDVSSVNIITLIMLIIITTIIDVFVNVRDTGRYDPSSGAGTLGVIFKEEYIDTGKVKLVFRDFPLNLPALQGSMIARCVGEDLHFKYLDALFSLQRSWVKAKDSEEYLFDIVKTGGISRIEFDNCLSNQKFEEPIITPTTKADEGHDENMTYQEVIDMAVSYTHLTLPTNREV